VHDHLYAIATGISSGERAIRVRESFAKRKSMGRGKWLFSRELG